MKFRIEKNLFGDVTVTLHPESKDKIKKIIGQLLVGGGLGLIAVQTINYHFDKQEDQE